jgi:hypothetical protein
MPYAIKYEYSFNTLQGDQCRVILFFKDYSGPVTFLNPTARPFVLREFNTDADLFKPIRGFQAELQFMSDNVTLDDFVSSNDDNVQVQLFFSNRLVWAGWLMQDDFQEDWIDVGHVITLRATDGLGQLSQDPALNIVGLAPVDEFLGDAITGTPIPTLFQATIVNNLYYDGMQDRDDGYLDPLSQVYVDGKTFEGDNNQQLVEKINKAWSQTLYQYGGQWWFVRQEELFHNDNVKGIVRGLFGNGAIDRSFNVSIGVNEAIKPIVPLMLRTIRRPFKDTKITFKYEYPNEILCNQNFQRGNLVPPTLNQYTIDCWTLYRGKPGASTAGTGTARRKVETDADGNVTDDYAIITTPIGHDQVLVSQQIYMNLNDSIDFGIEMRIPNNEVGPQNILAVAVSVEGTSGPFGASSVYWLSNDGEWSYITNGFTSQPGFINFSFSSGEKIGDWKGVNIRSLRFPSTGVLKVWLFVNLSIVQNTRHFKNVEVSIREAARIVGAEGDFDRYTIPDTVRNSYEEQSYLDDTNNRTHKGALFYNNDLTGDSWYRMRYPAERFTFKRHNAVAKMLLNRRYRNRLEVTMLGIKWMDGSVERPIWLMNRFRFVDDAPTKRFMIANLSEIDFMAAQWKATLIETYDTAVDDELTANYPPSDFGSIFKSNV